jgi:hypothetical protein
MRATLAHRFVERVGTDGLLEALRAGTRFVSRLSRRAKWHYQYHPRSVPDPDRTYHLDPAAIDYAIWHSDMSEHFGGKPGNDVLGGDWDLLKVAFEETYIYRGLFARFAEGKEWEGTEYYSVVRDADHRPDDPLDYLRQYDEMFEDMKENGFRDGNEVVVHVGRGGEYIRFNGFHRVSMAKILDLDEVPVRVSLRHRRWQRVRDRVARADSASELPDDVREHVGHPDLRDLL